MLLIGLLAPELTQAVGGKLWPAVTGEYTLEIHAPGTVNPLSSLEITHIPDVLPDHKGLAVEQLDVPSQHLSLVLLAEHLGRLGVPARESVGAEFGQDERLGILRIQRIQLRGERCEP